MTKPRIPITDSRFVYVPSCMTDIRVTFQRVREEMKKHPAPAKVTTFRRPT